MPRLARADVIVPNHPHHVVLRGNNRRRLFSYPYDFRLFLRLLDAAQMQSRVTVHAHCLMPNHVHLLLTPEDADGLAAFVKRVAQRFAQFRNRDGRGTGKLFEQRYYAAAIQDESHLAVATMYIEMNPVRARVSPAPEDYAWSSARRHLGLAQDEREQLRVWAPSEWYASLGAEPAARACEYDALMRDALARDAAALTAEWEQVESRPRRRASRRPNRGRAA